MHTLLEVWLGNEGLHIHGQERAYGTQKTRRQAVRQLTDTKTRCTTRKACTPAMAQSPRPLTSHWAMPPAHNAMSTPPPRLLHWLVSQTYSPQTQDSLASLSVRILPTTSIPSVHQAFPMSIKHPPWAHTCRSVMARPRMRAWMSWVPSYVFTASRFITWRMTDARHGQEQSQQQQQHMHKVIIKWSTTATATTTAHA